MNKFQELNVWKKSIDLVKEIYEVVAQLPVEEKFGLIPQIKRSAVSIPSNIAEGAGRNSNKEFIHFLSIATGSSYELQTQFILIKEFDMINDKSFDKIDERIQEIQKMIYGLQNHLKNL